MSLDSHMLQESIVCTVKWFDLFEVELIANGESKTKKCDKSAEVDIHVPEISA